MPYSIAIKGLWKQRNIPLPKKSVTVQNNSAHTKRITNHFTTILISPTMKRRRIIVPLLRILQQTLDPTRHGTGKQGRPRHPHHHKNETMAEQSFEEQ
jgi:hypothetical protein